MKIRYVNCAEQHAPIKDRLLAAVASVIDSGKFVLGPQVDEFEQRFAELCGVRHAIGVNSGTDALILALRALGVGPGDEVITAPNSFVASAACIEIVGAKPVFADVGEDFNLDPVEVKQAITPRTRALIPVHLTGRPADMNALNEIASESGIKIVEDAAQAVGAGYHGRPVGSLGDAGCFSLHPLKTLNACGDGGVLTTDDDHIAERVRLLRNLGLRSREDCVEWSSNSRLDTIQAAMLLVKLDYLNAWTEARRENAARYRHLLADVPYVTLPVERKYERSVYHTFVIQVDRRDELQAHLAAREIGTNVHYPVPIHLNEAAAGLGFGRGSFPVAERQAERILSLPIYPELTHDQITRIAESIREFYAQEASIHAGNAA